MLITLHEILEKSNKKRTKILLGNQSSRLKMSYHFEVFQGVHLFCTSFFEIHFIFGRKTWMCFHGHSSPFVEPRNVVSSVVETYSWMHGNAIQYLPTFSLYFLQFRQYVLPSTFLSIVTQQI